MGYWSFKTEIQLLSSVFFLTQTMESSKTMRFQLFLGHGLILPCSRCYLQWSPQQQGCPLDVDETFCGSLSASSSWVGPFNMLLTKIKTDRVTKGSCWTTSIMSTVIIRKKFDFSTQLSVFLSTQGFKAILRSIGKFDNAVTKLTESTATKLLPIFCSHPHIKNVITLFLDFQVCMMHSF
jgi:hypothetical protein